MSQVNITPWTATHTLTLPSGAVVKVRKRSMQSLLMAGILPMELLNKVQSMNAKDALKDATGNAADTLKKYLTIIVENCVIEPKIVMTGEAKDGEVSAADIPQEDLRAIISYFNGARPEGEAKTGVESFRPERPGSDAGSDGEEIQAAALRDSGISVV